jgi:hypothetical protein
VLIWFLFLFFALGSFHDISRGHMFTIDNHLNKLSAVR